MARTVQDVLNRAAEILGDEEFVRYTSAQLIRHTLDALETTRSLRPDLFVGQYGVELPDTLLATDPLPVPNNLFAAISLYVAGAAELRDDEFAIDNRAMTLQQALAKKLVTGM